MNPYLEAAEMVFNAPGTFSCMSIKRVGKSAADYEQMFAPPSCAHSNFWLDWAYADGLLEGCSKREWRLTALCLAAAMYESEDLD